MFPYITVNDNWLVQWGQLVKYSTAWYTETLTIGYKSKEDYQLWLSTNASSQSSYSVVVGIRVTGKTFQYPIYYSSYPAGFLFYKTEGFLYA